MHDFRAWLETDKSMQEKRAILNRLDAIFASMGTLVAITQIYQWYSGHASFKSVIAMICMNGVNIVISQILRRAKKHYTLIELLRSSVINQVMAAGIASVTDGPLTPFMLPYLISSIAVAPTLFYMRTSHLQVTIQVVNILNFICVAEFFAPGVPDHGLIIKLASLLIIMATTSSFVVNYLKIALRGQVTLSGEIQAGTRQIQEQQQFLQGYIDHFPGLAFAKNDTGVITLSNQAAQDVGAAQVFRALSAEDQQVIRAGGSLFTEESVAVHQTEEFYATTRFQIPRQNGSADECVIGINITQQRREDQELEQSRATMIAASKMSALGEMAGGIAHEINNPLAIILGKAQRIFESPDHQDLDLAMIEKHATKIMEITERISRITRSLQSFAREASHAPFEPISLEQIFAETLALCSERFKNKGIKIELENQDSLAIECRKTEVSQVLLHLLNNSYDAVQAFQEPWIRISAQDAGDSVEISVTDCGAGVPQEIQDKIFQPFFTTKAIGQGTGLGLSIVDGIVGTHHGRLTLDRASSQTKFTITLPKIQSPSTLKQAEAV